MPDNDDIVPEPTPEQIAENRDNTGRQLPYRAVSERELTTLEWRMLQLGYTHDDIVEYRRRTDAQTEAVMAALDRDRTPDEKARHGQIVRDIIAHDGTNFKYVPGGVPIRKPLNLVEHMFFIDKSKPALDGMVHVRAEKKRTSSGTLVKTCRNDPSILSDEGRVVPPYEGLASMNFSDQKAHVLNSMDERLAARKRILENLAALDQQTLPSEARPKQRVTITKAFRDSFKEHLEDVERMRLRKRANRRKTTKKRKQRLMGKRN